MPNDAFNGTTLTWPSTADTVADVLSLDFGNSAEAIDVTSSEDSIHTYVTGIEDPELTIEIVGGPATTNEAVGVSGALAISWFDGTTDAIATAVITEVSTSGGIDDKISTTLTFKPTP
tara:strand:- start:219 stop:572 length:354 start_codon:yes stop_codon:yes gene_type:complete